MEYGDKYIQQAFWEGPQRILAGMGLLLVAVLFSDFTLWILTTQDLFAGQLFDIEDFVGCFFGTFIRGAMSGWGMVFLAIDAWFIYSWLHRDESVRTFFFAIAANQMALFLCASLTKGAFEECWRWVTLALLVLGALYWGMGKFLAWRENSRE